MTAGSAETGGSGRRARVGRGRKAGGAPAEPGGTRQNAGDHEKDEYGEPQQQAPSVLTALPPTSLTDQQLREAVKVILEWPEEAESGISDSPFAQIRNPLKRAYLVAYALCGTVTRASRAASISMTTLYTRQWREDEPFQAAYKVAEEMSVQVMEDEAYRRAVEGWVEPTGWYKGEPGGYVRRFSDVLLIFKLKGARPDKYKDRVELRGMLGTIDFARCTDEQIERMRAGEHPLAVLGPGEPSAAAQRR